MIKRVYKHNNNQEEFDKLTSSFRENPVALNVLNHYGPEEIDYAIEHLTRVAERGLLPIEEELARRS
jgi:hypothetical protein